jgi:hypothetical protein
MRFSSKSRVGAIQCILAFCFVLLLSLSHTLYAQRPSSNLVLYDNFDDERFLDPAKWSPYGACFTWSVLECVREIQEDRLRLAVRNYGATTSNEGIQYGPSELHFINPAPIKTIAAQLVVRRTTAVGCPANTGEGSHAHALLSGNFFNSGSGIANDDVQAFLILDRFSSDPEGVTSVEAFMHWQGQFFGGVGLGTVNVGQKIIAKLSWDQPNHQFVVSWTDVVTGGVSQTVMPYNMSDIAPAAAPDKFVGVRTFAPNCIGTQHVFADMEATFDRVWIGK